MLAEVVMGMEQFLSTPSARRATPCTTNHRSLCVISIHALREEGDWLALSAFGLSTDFYPRPPRGGRLPARLAKKGSVRFLSTPSARRATRSKK